MMVKICSTKSRLVKIFDMFLHEGISTYNPKSTKASATDYVLAERMDQFHRKGAIFAVRKKSDFKAAGVKGFIITSKETLIEQADRLTHFTPNVFREYKYVDENRQYIKGFIENNLQQVNVFVVDIDSKDFSVEDISLACIDGSVGRPTLVLTTESGYQVFFALNTPLFISNKKDYMSLRVAKRIAENLKRSLQCVGADIYCNDFGFFRIPNSSNVERFDETATYSVKSLIQWSMNYDDTNSRFLYFIPPKLKLVSLLEADWFHHLIRATDIKGKKGQLGRNNVFFTLALVCYQESKDEQFTFDLLDQFNTNLHYPLMVQEMEKIIASAFSGKYFGAKKQYIEHLLELYVEGSTDIVVKLGTKRWYKHKKLREERQRSHYDEWEQDVCNWIDSNKEPSQPFLWCTQKALCAAVGIPSSTLNKLMSLSKKLLKTVSGKGRASKTGWTTVEHYMAYIIWLKKECGKCFFEGIRKIVSYHLDLLEPVAGYLLIRKYFAHILKIPSLSEQLTLEENAS